jgi:hypothetical protein
MPFPRRRARAPSLLVLLLGIAGCPDIPADAKDDGDDRGEDVDATSSNDARPNTFWDPPDYTPTAHTGGSGG